MSDLVSRLKALRGLLQPRVVVVEGHRFTIPRGVLDPCLFRSGEVLARFFMHQFQPGQRVLDLGCGSGIVGVLAQSQGAQVIASDIDPRACSAARANGLSDVREADLFDGLHGHHFDHIVFNPPYLKGNPNAHPLGRSLYGGENLDVLRRYLDEFHSFLDSAGAAWVILSSREPRAIAMLHPSWVQVDECVVIDEKLSIYKSSS